MKVLCEGIGKRGVALDNGYPACPDCGREFSAQGRKAQAPIGNPWVAIPKHYTEVRGRVTYDDYFGHVCTCTAKATTVTFAGFEGEHGSHDRTVYEQTVVCDRSSGTESGSFYYHCTRCGAGTWSGL